MITDYEYGIFWKQIEANPHRDGLTEEEAREWVESWLDDGGAEDTFIIVKRALGPWEVVDD